MAASNPLPAAGPEGLAAMYEVLAESLPLARQWARQDCWSDPATGRSCAWYHGAWQALRLLGLVSTLTHQSELYIKALRPLIADGSVRRVFLSGSADYGLLSVILDAFRQEDVVPEITMVDRCTTPLRLCRWFAEKYGYTIDTVQSDLTEFRAEAPYDFIGVHSLLACVPRERHAGIVRTWNSLLRPGGILMMAQPIYPGITFAKTTFTDEQIAAYKKRVLAAVETCSQPQALPPLAELEQLAEAYAGNMESNVISAPGQLTDLLEAGGFEFLETRFELLIKDPNHQRSGAPMKTDKIYGWIVAARR